MNQLVYSYFQLSEKEIAMIEEFTSLVGPSVQPTYLRHSVLMRPIRKTPEADLMQSYSVTLEKTLSGWRDATGGKGLIQVATWTGRCVPIGVAVLTLGDQATPNKFNDDKIIETLPPALRKRIDKSGDTLLTVPDVAVIEGDHIYLLKPMIARFWMRRCAIEDGNRIAMQLQALPGERVQA